MYDYLLPLTKPEQKTIWEQGLIVFDSNILLNLYSFDEGKREKLIASMDSDKIKERLWIPAKVYEEFLTNRKTVIYQQLDIQDKINKIVDKIWAQIQSTIPKNHPYIDRTYGKDKMQKIVDEIKENMKTQKKNLYKLTPKDDTLLPEILNLFSSRIGDPFTDDELKEIYVEGKERYANKIPPGYKDIDKPELEMSISFWD